MKRTYLAVLVFCFITQIAHATILNGTCGANLTWSLNTEDSTLVIEGTGDMTSCPWKNYYANIAYLSLPEGLLSIMEDAFKSCVLTNVIIPNSVKTIEQGSFRDTQLKTVTIGENAAEIGMCAFACNTLQTVNWNVIRYNDTINTNTGYGTNKIITSYSSLNKGFGGSNPTPFYSSSQTYGNNITSFNLGEQVQYIPKCLCEGLVGLEEITIPQSIKEINADVFFGCSNLTSVQWNATNAKVVLKSNIESLWTRYYSLFMGTQHPQLQSITFGEEVETIPEYLCLSVSSLTTITLGHKVNSISTFTFKNSGINTIYFTGSLQEWCSLNHSNLMLRESRMGGTSGWAEGDLYIQDMPMDSLIIPHDITNISNYSFRGCKNIHSVTLEATTPPTIGYKVFTDTLRIHVPYCAYPDYYESNQWKDYRTRIIETTSFAINLQANDNTLGYINISTRNCETHTITITAQPAYKCKFIRWSDGNTQQTRDVSLNSDINLTAYFAQINYYTVKFIDWDETELNSQQVEEGQSAIPPTDPSRDGYTFVGWDKDFINVTSNLSIYAQYEKNITYFIVTFLDWDGTELYTEQVEEGKDAVGPSVVPSREGYTFIGWSKPITNIQSNLTVIAQYQLNEGIEDIYLEDTIPHKLLNDGQIFILRGDKTYTITGAEVK